MHRFLIGLAGLVAALALAPAAFAVSGAGYTTVNPTVDGNNHCKNGNPAVNCNIYDGKEYVWLNGGPAANGLGPDGQYFFAVLAPGGQPNPNDGGPKNLSDDFDTVQNRTFTVTNGEVSAYAGTHDKTIPLIRLFPYADTTNPGGVYIMAICSLGSGYPVAPRSCKYDAFKVQKGVARVQAVLSGSKYLDGNKNGMRDAGEPGLKDWQVTIVGTDGTNTTVLTNGSGDWSYTVPAHAPAAGTTSYMVKEVQQAGWVQTGNTVDQSVAAGGASVALAALTYTVTVPNNAVSAVEELLFGNYRDQPPSCPAPSFGTNQQGQPIMWIDVQDADTGLASINILYTRNITVDILGFSFGTTLPVRVVGTAIDVSDSMGLTFEAFDLAGNRVECDPVLATVDRATGKPATETFSGLPAMESNVTIRNGSPGVAVAEVTVNGVLYRLTGLKPGEEITLDVAAAMVAGNGNAISVTLHGPPGGTAVVFIWG